MSDHLAYKPTPYKDRPSQNLGWGEYLRKHVSILLLPPVLSLVGYVVGMQFKAPPLLTNEQQKKLSAFGQYQNIMLKLVGGEHKGRLFASYGGKIGTAISAFLAWKHKEKTRLEVSDTVREVKEISGMHATDEILTQDNQILKDMIAFEQEKQPALHQQRLKAQEELAGASTELQK